MRWTHVEAWDCYISETLRAIYSVIKVLASYVGQSYQLHASTTRFSSNDVERLGALTTWVNSSIHSEDSTLVHVFREN